MADQSDEEPLTGVQNVELPAKQEENHSASDADSEKYSSTTQLNDSVETKTLHNEEIHQTSWRNEVGEEKTPEKPKNILNDFKIQFIENRIKET